MKKLLVIAALALSAVACGGAGGEQGAQSRTELVYTYYGSYGNQVEETKDHTNAHWEAFWHDEDAALARLEATDKMTILDVERIWHRVSPTQRVLRPDADLLLRDLFDKLRTRGKLDRVGMVVPIDEPNLPENRVCDELPQAIETIRDVMGEYPELHNTVVGTIYYYHAKWPMCHLQLPDVVGFNEYGAGATILKDGKEMDQMLDALAPHQRAMLVPGGSYGQDPEPFLQYAERRPQVWMIVNFLWHYPSERQDIPSIRTTPIRDAYIRAGQSVVH